jgi:hypothetical protein
MLRKGMRGSGLAQVFRSRELRLAWLIAIVADAIQIAGFPFFAEGGFSPADTIVDLVAAFVLSRLVGWHWAFLPTLVAELLPGFDLFPTWSAAMGYITWQRACSVDPTVIDVEPLPPRRLPKS